jgi:hypothetical protein
VAAVAGLVGPYHEADQWYMDHQRMAAELITTVESVWDEPAPPARSPSAVAVSPETPLFHANPILKNSAEALFGGYIDDLKLFDL